MSLLLKIVDHDCAGSNNHKSFPNSQYANARIVMDSWFRQDETDSCVLYLMSDDPDLYASDWVELERKTKL